MSAATGITSGLRERVLTFSLDISVGPKIIAMLGTPILLTLTSSTTLQQKQRKTVAVSKLLAVSQIQYKPTEHTEKSKPFLTMDTVLQVIASRRLQFEQHFFLTMISFQAGQSLTEMEVASQHYLSECVTEKERYILGQMKDNFLDRVMVYFGKLIDQVFDRRQPCIVLLIH